MPLRAVSHLPITGLDAALRVASALAEEDPVAFAANKRWLDRGMKAALAEARVAHEGYRNGPIESFNAEDANDAKTIKSIDTKDTTGTHMYPLLKVGVLLMAGSLAAAAHAQYPSKPVRLVVPFAPGGPVDTIARAMSPKLAEALGQQIVIDNRPGAGSIIGTDAVAKAAPDGHTLLIISSSIAINPSIYRKMPYDPARNFVPITQLATSALIVVVHPSVPARSIKDLIALAKARRGELIYASSGTGSAPHLSVELFKSMTGTQMVHVPYKGAAPATIDLLAGHVALMLTSWVVD